MFECVMLNRRNMDALRQLNDNRKKFNELNEDFFDLYDNCNFAQKIFLKRTVFLLKSDAEYFGFIWFTFNSRNYCYINSMFVSEQYSDLKQYYSALLSNIDEYTNLQYSCIKNDNNYNLLESLGFILKEGTISLSYTFHCNYSMPDLPKNVLIKQLKVGKDELIRCRIQNDVFEVPGRIPLTVDDIFYDEDQKYYFDKGAFFIMEGDKHVGYGQIIIEDCEPVIVNLGILKEFRGKGYGKYLVMQLLYIIMQNNFHKAMIRVSTENKIALRLYESVGFKIESEKSLFELKILRDH